MASRSCNCGLLLVLFCGAATDARAEIMVGNSLEWLTCQADVVVIGRIEKIVTSAGPGDVLYDDCTVIVQDAIKGWAPGPLVFCYRGLSNTSPARAWIKAEQPLLLFLSYSHDHGSEKHLDGKLVPTSSHMPLSVIDLGAPGKYAINKDFQVISSKDAVVKTCRSTAKQLAEHLQHNKLPAGTKVKDVQREVPHESSAHTSLYAGSACYLKVPAFLDPPVDKK